MEKRVDVFGIFLFLGTLLLIGGIAFAVAKPVIDSDKRENVVMTVVDKNISYSRIGARYSVSFDTGTNICTIDVESATYAQLEIGMQVYTTAWFHKETGKCTRVKINYKE